MSAIYDNWDRLVGAVLRREEIWQLFHSHSRTPSICSTASDFSYSSQLSDFPFDFSSPSSWYQRDGVSEIGVHGWGYNANDLEAKSDNVKEFASGDIFVNGKPLSSRELSMLQRCRYPPKKLKPGNYWYDKHSGFWGKQGHKPSQIVSVNLNIGGRLEPHASGGNTLHFINGREITKPELRVLQLDSGNWDRHTHFWMYEDGSYQEEGMNYIRGNIWGKVGLRLLCGIFSLPLPPKYSYTSREPSVSGNFEVASSYTSGESSVSHNFEEGAIFHEILLIGNSGSGTSTIFKQAVFLYKDIPFLEDELRQIKLLIQSNIYGYIRILLEDHKQIKEANLKESRESQCASEHGLVEYPSASDTKSTYSFGPKLKAFSDWILQLTESSSLDVFSASFIQATIPLIEELWRNPTFQETFMHKSELQRLHSAAHYFLERALQIFKPDYEPSKMDILCAESFPSSLSYVDFSFPPPRDDEFDIWCEQDLTRRYRLIRPNDIGDNNTLFEISEDVRIVIFCVSLCDYDQFVITDDLYPVNKMIYNRQCFESTVTNPVFDQNEFLLLLIKYDLFEEKITRIPLNQCDWLDDFHPVPEAEMSTESLGEKAFQYISVKFKRLYTALTGRKLYVTKVNCLKQDSVDEALRYMREIVKWEYEMNDYI